VCQIIEVLGLAPSTVSKHLSVLSSAGLVVMRKEGRWAYYRLSDGAYADATRPLIEWLRGALQGASTVERDRVMLEAVLALNLCDVARNQRSR
jgi:DNA-binding transcriptional ArsR family regulator